MLAQQLAQPRHLVLSVVRQEEEDVGGDGNEVVVSMLTDVRESWGWLSGSGMTSSNPY